MRSDAIWNGRSDSRGQNPYWKTFNPYVEPLLEREMDLRRCEELEGGK